MGEKKQSGFSAEELFERGQGITYKDFTILNTIFSDIADKDISLKTDLGKGVVLEFPVMASPMDTVANAAVGIVVALEGGITVLHYNHVDSNGKPDIGAQVKEIEQVKRFQSGFIEDPVTISPNFTIAQAIEKGRRYKVGDSVIDTFPVTENGESNGKLVGLLRKQDYSRNQKTDLLVNERMLPLEKLVVGKSPMTLAEANDYLWEKHVPSLPIVDENGNLVYLVTKTDIEKNEAFPLATKDERNRLRVLFAVDTHPDSAHERLERGFEAGADGVVVDTSQGFTKYEQDMLKHIVGKYPDKLLIGGNISTLEAAAFLARNNVDAYRCGQGSGSICTTPGGIGISRAGAVGVYDSAMELRESKTRTIADGGLKEVGDIFKALGIGAHCVMLGNMLAGTEEGPGEVISDPITGVPVKVYRGMGSEEANVSSIRGYSRLPQGVSGKVRYRGSIHKWLPLIRDGLTSAFKISNCRNIGELHKKMYDHKLRFERRTVGSVYESGTQDVR